MSSEQSTKSKTGLVVQQLCCVRGGRMLFRDLDFQLEGGQAGLLTGPNGIGKSSLLRVIAGLLEPYSGTISAPYSKAFCDDKLSLDEQMPLEKALQFWAKLDGQSAADLDTAMARAELSHLAEVPPKYFSTGQRQRARLARIFLSNARLWLLDEPANGLDGASVDKLGLAMQDHLDSGGIILAASHIPLPIDFDLSLQLSELESLEASL